MYCIVYNSSDKFVRVCIEAPDEAKVKDVDESILSFETKEEAKAFINENINERTKLTGYSSTAESLALNQ